MTMIGTVILAIALFFAAVDAAMLYILLVMANPTKQIASRYRPRRKVLRTLYGKDWNRIMEMTKIEERGENE